MVLESRIRCSAFAKALRPKLATFFLVLIALNTSVNWRRSALCMIGDAEAVSGICKSFASFANSEKYSKSIPLYFGLIINEVCFGKLLINFLIFFIQL